jgi:dolichyl-diphosphooligosaccharide--protein glycosyltransferase
MGAGDGYPNPGEFISELRKIGLFNPDVSAFSAASGGLVNRLGGLFVYVLYLIGIVVLCIKIFKFLKYKPRVEKPELKPEYIIGLILVIWALGGTISLNGGSRFVKILAIPFNLIVSYLIGSTYEQYKDKKIKYAGILLSMTFLIAPIIGAYKIGINMYTSATDSLDETAKNIKSLTKEKDVVATWWDYGYFFESQAERRTVADGGTYNGRFIYYLATAFGTSDQLLSSNIFKMLANDGVSVTYLTDEYLGGPTKGNKALKDALSKKTAEEAKKVLIEQYKLNDKQATEITSYTHPNLDYKIVLVITESMLRMKTPINFYTTFDFDTGTGLTEGVDDSAVLIQLYNLDKDTEYFTHMFRNTDVTGRLSTNVFYIN